MVNGVGMDRSNMSRVFEMAMEMLGTVDEGWDVSSLGVELSMLRCRGVVEASLVGKHVVKMQPDSKSKR